MLDDTRYGNMSKEAACAKYDKWMKWQVAISEQGYAQNLSL